MTLPNLKSMYQFFIILMLTITVAMQVMNGYVIYTVYTHIMIVSPRRQGQLDSLRDQNAKEILLLQQIKMNSDLNSAKINDHTNTLTDILEKQTKK